jgi:hypothetical protein
MLDLSLFPSPLHAAPLVLPSIESEDHMMEVSTQFAKGVEGMGLQIFNHICRGVLRRFEPENFGPGGLIFRRQR